MGDLGSMTTSVKVAVGTMVVTPVNKNISWLRIG